MTLLEMIKKYEKIKVELESMEVKRIKAVPVLNDVAVAKHILKDLKSIGEQPPSWGSIRDKIIKQIDKGIDLGFYDDAQTLAHILSMLPK